MDNIQQLLKDVSKISKKYESSARITGENFNIFSIMQMETNEVYTHSAFIAELLNPKGSHGQGSIFLKLFFEEIKNIKTYEDFDFENAKILVEEHIGFINEDYTKGGFIDIVIKDNKNQIVIENKIYASDQTNQLVRYKNHYENCTLLYLTLDGKEPSADSKGDLNLNECFHCISYSEVILRWLSNCITKTFEQPILREAIKQYEYLIKKLTNQTPNKQMEKEITEILKSDIKSSFLISQNLQALKTNLYYQFIELIKKYCQENNFDFNVEDGDKEYGIYLKPKEWNAKNYKICLIFETGDYNGFYYGLWYEKNISENNKINLQNLFESEKFEKNDIWIWQYAKDRNWSGNSEIWEDVAKGENSKIYKESIEKINQIIEIEKTIQ